ncbi:MAG TPA: tRNA lysidine(34) synthetase TilS, partial [Sphingomonas sp.]|nr:tRNA lysidine(34) synthetase TilS [Sphingomonas sp.]
MPSATVDARLVERFRADLDQLLLESDAGGPNARLGVALSGGPDSGALLILAAAAAPGRVTALTVNHQIRPESGAEADRAAAMAASLGVPHRIARVMVERRASVQAAAREARYAALAQWADEEGLGAVLTAHHADDQAETLLMRLARGAGVAGLAGIRPARRLLPSCSCESRSPEPQAPPSETLGSRFRGNTERTLLLRPLLGWRKAELEAIVAAA